MLKQRASELGVTESEVIRQAIEQAIQAPVADMRDFSDWDAQIEFARSRPQRSIAEAGGDRGWTREELYDRLDRFSR